MVVKRLKKKGEAGAAKNYITRTKAIKKLQCSLADFRRLCILKGIFPREPRSRKKANKGSTAPTSFYYIKDIQYLLHEPVLEKLRAHKTFAKKLSRALGREQFGLAKNLQEQKPMFKIDHIIKERYPTFPDALRDLDDALSLVMLFAHLPASPQVSATVIANCARLTAEWQLYVMRSRSLRKVFLSIKGIYYQAEVKGQTITWLVPFSFTQNIPSDIDFRIMLTFIELYQTLLGFCFYKLYTDNNLIYPPTIDQTRDEGAAGIGALLLEETSRHLTVEGQAETEQDAISGKKISAKQVKKQISKISKNIEASAVDAVEEEAAQPATVDEEMVETGFVDASGNVLDQTAEASTTLFDNYVFFLSREVTRPTLEFVIRSFGGQVGWDPVLGLGSPFTEDDPRITHHVVDRPIPTDPEALAVHQARLAAYPGKRVLIQPQWVVDCVNRSTILSTGPYSPGATLPPHLSPFVNDKLVKEQGGYVPAEALGEEAVEEEVEDEEESESEEEEVEEEEEKEKTLPPALMAAAQNPANEELQHAAEIEAETRNLSHAQFQAELKQAKKEIKKNTPNVPAGAAKKRSAAEEEDLKNIMITGKKRKVYNKIQHSKGKKAEEREKLEQKKKALQKAEKRSKRGL